MDFLLLYLYVVLLLSPALVQGQQTYVANHQLDCYNNAFNETTKGFLCNGVQSSCQSYLTFRSMPPYNSPVFIAYLLGVSQSATLIASINNLSSDTAIIPNNMQVVVPVNCSCYARQYYQHNVNYTLKHGYETSRWPTTHQGLTTCQSSISQNPYVFLNLTAGLILQKPLRCACPTSNQNALGVKYLLTYMVNWAIPSLTSCNPRLFGVDHQRLFDANMLSSSSVIFPFTSGSFDR